MAQNSEQRFEILLIVIVSIIFAAICLTSGYLVGRYSLMIKMKRVLAERASSFTMCSVDTSGRILQDNIYAYHDRKQVLEVGPQISWNVPMMFTPFVGSMPLPGKHGNSFINARQMRYRGEAPIPKGKSEYRIFLVGASTAFGSGASAQDRTIGGYLEKMLNSRKGSTNILNYRVYTAATPAWASTHERILVENVISELEPDLVISLSGNNDVHWGFRGRNIYWFRTYEDRLYSILINGALEMAACKPFPNPDVCDDKPIPPGLVAERIKKNVRLAAYTLASINRPYIFVLQPTLSETKRRSNKSKKPSQRDKYFTACYSSMRKSLSGITLNNFTFLDFSGVLDHYPGAAHLYLDSYHFGDKGYEIIAEKIFEHLSDNLPTFNKNSAQFRRSIRTPTRVGATSTQ